MRKALLMSAFAVLLVSCSILPSASYTETYYYDIGFPEAKTKHPGYYLEVDRFKVKGPYSDKMVFRDAENQLAFGEYNRWSVVPAKMLERYFVMAFDNGLGTNLPKDKQYVLTGEILQFEANLKKKSVDLIVFVNVENKGTDQIVLRGLFEKHVPVEEVTGGSFADGMKKAVDQIVADLHQKLSGQGK